MVRGLLALNFGRDNALREASFIVSKNKKNFRIKIEKKTLEAVVENYTRESGVRELDKKIGKIFRRLACSYATNGYYSHTNIKPIDLRELLGVQEFSRDRYQGNEYAGVVTGLAWTAVGGDILYIESVLTPGKGALNLTGNLGDVAPTMLELLGVEIPSDMSGKSMIKK